MFEMYRDMFEVFDSGPVISYHIYLLGGLFFFAGGFSSSLVRWFYVFVAWMSLGMVYFMYVKPSSRDSLEMVRQKGFVGQMVLVNGYFNSAFLFSSMMAFAGLLIWVYDGVVSVKDRVS